MAEPLRHRQTKEAATDMVSLQQPRHISTLPRLGKARGEHNESGVPQKAEVAATLAHFRVGSMLSKKGS
jgi:hypothetical protein